MKKLILVFCLTIGLGSLGRAQTSPPPASPPKTVLDASTIVKDSTGHQYSYDIWTALLTSGKFSLKRSGVKTAEGKPEYLIYPISATNKQRVYAQTRTPQKPKESDQFHAGDVFKPFKEKAFDGEKIDLKKNAGKVYVVNFWFIGCPPCRAEIPDLNAIADKYKDNKDVVFVAICLDDADAVERYMKINPFNYHIIDGGRYIAEKYGVHLYPTNVVVNRDGKVAYSSVSNQPSNPYWISKTIDEALASPVTAPLVPSK
ncbi:MAG: TlpA disulfide reductase family protein [Mucilaginibacter sp.]|uniref:TlpA family protein disulfide reductase n=1 Tax=Mucilaginibacter sp. TaxID=1882438 RepID=UPI0032632422